MLSRAGRQAGQRRQSGRQAYTPEQAGRQACRVVQIGRAEQRVQRRKEGRAGQSRQKGRAAHTGSQYRARRQEVRAVQACKLACRQAFRARQAGKTEQEGRHSGQRMQAR
jgi:hypothetical protein